MNVSSETHNRHRPKTLILEEFECLATDGFHLKAIQRHDCMPIIESLLTVDGGSGSQLCQATTAFFKMYMLTI